MQLLNTGNSEVFGYNTFSYLFVNFLSDLEVSLSEEETMERDAVHKALMSLIRQDPKGSLISLQ